MKLIICVIALVASAMGNTDLERILHESNDQFTTKMFSEVVKSKPSESVVISAFSVLSPLAQLALASTGETHDETLRTIRFPSDNVTKEVFPYEYNKLRSVSGVELKLVNRIYVRAGAELNNQFAAVSRDIFNSDVKNVDFSKNVEVAAEINAWVEDNTNHRIKDLVNPDSLDSDTAAVLVNAIYFKGKWKIPFLKTNTRERDFHVTKDKKVKVSMMFQSDTYKYGESKELNAKLLEMFYEGEQTSLLIILPHEVDGIHALTEKLSDTSLLANAVARMFNTEMEVYLPKFKIETTTNLKEVLFKMGCNRLFTRGQAQLDNLLKGVNDLHVSDAIQKAFIEVSEEGTEAAAGNEFRLSLNSMPLMFTADHPFIFFLKEGNNILFSGVFQS